MAHSSPMLRQAQSLCVDPAELAGHRHVVRRVHGVRQTCGANLCFTQHPPPTDRHKLRARVPDVVDGALGHSAAAKLPRCEFLPLLSRCRHSLLTCFTWLAIIAAAAAATASSNCVCCSCSHAGCCFAIATQTGGTLAAVAIATSWLCCWQAAPAVAAPAVAAPAIAAIDAIAACCCSCAGCPRHIPYAVQPQFMRL